MNRITKYISVVLAGVGTAACSLDTESMSSIDSNTFYRSMADIEAARVGCYDGYRRIVASTDKSFYLASEIMSDDCFGGTGVGDAGEMQMIDRFDLSLSPAQGPNTFETLWSTSYTAIFNCNTLLANADRVEWKADASRNCDTPEKTRAAYEGEARFLRAMIYFDLVRLFERVPLLTVPTKEVVPQADPKETYAQIIADLKFACENIPYQPTKEWHKSYDGTATAQAAAAMLGRVYLFYTGYYGEEPATLTKAETIVALESIEQSGYYGLVQTGTDGANGFRRLWRAAMVTDNGPGKGLDSHTWVGRACEHAEVNEFIFTQKFNYLSNYNGNASGNRWLVMMGIRNGTKADMIPYGSGWGAATVNPESWSIYSEDDARRNATIINLVGEGRTEVAAEVKASDWREYTGYNMKKYIPLSYNVGGKPDPEVSDSEFSEGLGDKQLSQYQDFVVMRYADVLLMLAELKEDAEYMNQVRRRAGLKDLPYSKETLLEERHREFMGEAIRYWDLLRQGVNYAADKIAGKTYKVTSGGIDDQVVIVKENIITKRGLSCIPMRHITESKNVYTQNPGW